MKQDKALAMIGLAQKAGKIVSGEFATEKAVKTGKACTGYCCRRCIGKYKEDVYKYVCIL